MMRARIPMHGGAQGERRKSSLKSIRSTACRKISSLQAAGAARLGAAGQAMTLGVKALKFSANAALDEESRTKSPWK